jgi:hypothetical protein
MMGSVYKHVAPTGAKSEALVCRAIGKVDPPATETM